MFGIGSYSAQAMRWLGKEGAAAGRAAGEWAAGTGAGQKYLGVDAIVNNSLGQMGVRYGAAAAQGAAVGAAIGGITGAADRDRSMLGGVVGGAFWGAAAGVGGRALQAGLTANRSGIIRETMARTGADRSQASQAYSGMRKWARPGRSAAYVTGAYGGVNALMGGGRQRKSRHSTFHHGEPY